LYLGTVSIGGLGRKGLRKRRWKGLGDRARKEASVQ
jgi:hypothetical protein